MLLVALGAGFAICMLGMLLGVCLLSWGLGEYFCGVLSPTPGRSYNVMPNKVINQMLGWAFC